MCGGGWRGGDIHTPDGDVEMEDVTESDGDMLGVTVMDGESLGLTHGGWYGSSGVPGHTRLGDTHCTR